MSLGIDPVEKVSPHEMLGGQEKVRHVVVSQECDEIAVVVLPFLIDEEIKERVLVIYLVPQCLSDGVVSVVLSENTPEVFELRSIGRSKSSQVVSDLKE